MNETEKNSLQSSSQILVSHYIFERQKQIQQLHDLHERVQDNQKHSHKKTSLKRPIGRIHHRTRSHKSFKMPRKKVESRRKRKLRINELQNSTKKQATSSIGPLSKQVFEENRCRKHRRRSCNIHLFVPKKGPSTTNPKKKLTTHVWHAKRMGMGEYYGYMLPMRSAFRGFKALEKMIEENSGKTFLHDASYYQATKVTTNPTEFARFIESYSVNHLLFLPPLNI